MKKAVPKIVIFDLDGTLVNAYRAVAESVNYTLKALGLPLRSYDEIRRSVGGGDYKLMAHFVGEELALKAIALYRPHHGKALAGRGNVKLLPGVLGTLKYLKSHDYKLAIASNRPTKFTRIILKELDILKFFDVVLCADRAPKPKPYPDILWSIIKRLKASKAETIYVGDMDIDINCARRAKVRVVTVATGSCTAQELKDLKPWAFIDKMVELKSIIKNVPLG